MDTSRQPHYSGNTMMNKIKVLVLAGFMMLSAPLMALEIILFHAKWCPYCQQFDKELGVDGYNATEQGKIAPMTIIDVTYRNHVDWNGREDIKTAFKNREIFIQGVPTFLLWDEEAGEQVGAMTGYENKDKLLRFIGKAICRHTTTPDGVKSQPGIEVEICD